MGDFIQRINNSAVRDGAYLPTLDGWRAIAILLVIAAHGSDSIARFLQSIVGAVDLSSIRHIGLFGVQIFFGLSGLLITSRLIADEKKTWANIPEIVLHTTRLPHPSRIARVSHNGRCSRLDRHFAR